MVGIYAIRNILNGKLYIGSSKDVNSRWAQHRHHLRRGNALPKHLQAAWSKYGETNFSFEVLELVADISRLLEREQAWIDRFPFTRLYNKRPIAESNRGWKPSPEFGIACANRFRGIAKSAEQRAKMSAAQRGRTPASGVQLAKERADRIATHAEHLRKLRAEGFSIKRMSQQLELSPSCIRSYLRTLNIPLPLRTHTYVLKSAKRQTDFTFNIHPNHAS